MKQMGAVAAVAATGLAVLAAAGAEAQPKQVVTGPVATYWMTAETVSGIGAGRGGIGMAAAMMAGRAPAAAHNLHLQLGSGRKAAGEPSAEHLPPAVLRAGASLPLVSLKVEKPAGDVASEWNGTGERPKGKMLIYWGCGEKAGPGQPVVIDFAKLGTTQTQAFAGANVKAMTPPSAGRHPTYGEWPNHRAQMTVPANGSLVGDHVVRGNYTPEIRFALGAANDFLAPIAPTNGAMASGAVRLAWSQVPNAKAYVARTVGSADDGTIVMWSSSEKQVAAMGLPDFMAGDDLARLVGQKVLMAPQATECAVPAEVARATPNAMLQMVAFGPEANFSYPPRPSDPKQAWNIEWTAKVRSKSAYAGMLGVEMPAVAEAGGDDEVRPGAAGGQPVRSGAGAAAAAASTVGDVVGGHKKRALFKGLGSVLSKLPN
jgi:hypothetical protein